MKKIYLIILITLKLMFLSACLEGDIDTWIWEDGDGIEINERAPGTKRGLVVRALSNTIDLNNAGTFNVALNTNPGKDITVSLGLLELSGNSTISTGAFLLNSSNWLNGHPITISGVCDTLTDNATFALNFSTNENYPSTFQYLDSTFTNGDNSSMERGTNAAGNYADNLTGIIYEADKIGVRKSQNFTTESSGNSTIYISLCKPPTSNVTVSVSSTDATEGALSSNSVIFSSGNWSTEVPVNVLGQDDSLSDGPVGYSIEVAAVGYPTEIVSLENYDNETPQIITSVSAISSVQEGSNTTLNVSLSSAPTSNVVIPISVRDTPSGSSSSHVSVSPSSITFTSGDFSTPQTITLTGKSDSLSEGLVSYYLYLGPANTADSNYSNLPAKVLIGQVYD